MRREAAIFKALSDETRLQMLGLLLREEGGRGELCVCDVMEVLGITQSKASRHLRRLVDAGLLQDRREAVWVHFKVASDPEPAQAAVLEMLRTTLPERVPAALVERLAEWRARKCDSRCAARRTRAGRRASEEALT